MKKKKGMALATVLAILLILVVVGVSVSLMAISHAGFTFNTKNEASALAAARAGISRAIVAANTIPNQTTPNWAAPALATQVNLYAPSGTPQYPDPSNTHIYFEVGVDSSTANTALITSTGYVVNGGKVLKSKTIHAFIHEQYPLSAGAAYYSSGPVTWNGGASFTCSGGSGSFVDMGGATNCSGGNVSGCTCESPPYDSALWPFPNINITQAIADAKGNNSAFAQPLGPAPKPYDWPAPITHYWPPSSLSSGTDDFTKALDGVSGSNFIDATGVPGVTIKINGSAHAITPCPAPPVSTPPGPSFIIVKNANLWITGSFDYAGSIIDYGTITLQGSSSFDGDVFATSGIVAGGAGITATFNKNCLEDLGPLFMPLVVIDSLWQGTQAPAVP